MQKVTVCNICTVQTHVTVNKITLLILAMETQQWAPLQFCWYT